MRSREIILRLLPIVACLAAARASAENVCSKSAEELDALRASKASAVASAFEASTGERGFSLAGGQAPCNWTCEVRDPRKSCMSRWEKFLTYNCTRPAPNRYQQGRTVPDNTYYEDAERRWSGKDNPPWKSGAPDNISLLSPPEGLLRAAMGWPATGPTGGTSGTVKTTDFMRYLQNKGYTFIRYNSTSVSNPPDGYGRVLVLIPGGSYDQWIQIATNPNGNLGDNVDFAAVEKRDPATGSSVSPPNVYFKGYGRVGNHMVTEGADGGPGRALSKCYSCHPSGLRTVFPDMTARNIPDPSNPGKKTALVGSTPDGSDALKVMRERMAVSPMNVGPENDPAKGPSYVPTDNGDAMGPVKPVSERVAGILGPTGGCAPASLPDTSRRRIAAAMNCAECHDGVNRGIINAGTNPFTIAHKISGANLSAEARMPPKSYFVGKPGFSADETNMGNGNSPLTSDEQRILVACLRKEYASQLKSWLLNSSCVGNCLSPPAPVISNSLSDEASAIVNKVPH